MTATPKCTFADCQMVVLTADLCSLHYKRFRRTGTAGCPVCRVHDLPHGRRCCFSCTRAAVREHGFELLEDPKTSGEHTLMRCLAAGHVAKRKTGRVTAGDGCGPCEVAARKEKGAHNRLVRERVAEIVKRAGWTLTGDYRGSHVPVEAVCDACGDTYEVLLADIHPALKNGIRRYGCRSCTTEHLRPEWYTATAERLEAKLAESGLEYVGGFTDIKEPVEVRCPECLHTYWTTPVTVARGSGCRKCNRPGFWDVTRLARHPELAGRPAKLYWIEFTDWDAEETVFQKVGVSTKSIARAGRAEEYGRLYGHIRNGARLLGSAKGTLLECLTTEQAILATRRTTAYCPTPGRIDSGRSECFHPGEPLDLEAWMARTS